MVALLVLAIGMAGCESTQDKSARLEAEAKRAVKRHQAGGLRVRERSREIRVEDTVLLRDANGVAAVVLLRNVSRQAMAAVPLAIQVRDRAKRTLYANDGPGLDPSLVSAALVRPRSRVAWVNDQLNASAAGALSAVAGAGARPVEGAIPRVEASGVHLEDDPSAGLSAVGTVTNRSDVPQRRLVVHAVARRGTRIVAAGRAIVDRLAPGASARFSVFFIGNPRGARVSVSVPPTVLR